MFVEKQLEILRWMMGLRGPITDPFFVFLNFFDTFYYWVILIPLFWFFGGRRVGLHFLFFLLLSGVANTAIKNLFALPRPFFYDPSIALIVVGGYTFPSGAAQGSMLLALMVWDLFRSKKLIPWLILYVFIISLSRNLLGVHFPLDILGGWVVGFLLYLTYKFIYLPCENKISLFSKKILLLPLVITFIAWALFPIAQSADLFFIMLGVAFSWVINDSLALPIKGASFSLKNVVTICLIIGSLFGILFLVGGVIPKAFYKTPLLLFLLGSLMVFEIGVALKLLRSHD